MARRRDGRSWKNTTSSNSSPSSAKTPISACRAGGRPACGDVTESSLLIAGEPTIASAPFRPFGRFGGTVPSIQPVVRTPGWAGLESGSMFPCAYLRVFQPLAAFPTHERQRWERYIVAGGRTPPVRPIYRERPTVPEGRIGLLSSAEGDHADVRTIDGVVYVCPWRTRLRELASLLSLRESTAPEMVDAFVPESEAKRAQRELAGSAGTARPRCSCSRAPGTCRSGGSCWSPTRIAASPRTRSSATGSHTLPTSPRPGSAPRWRSSRSGARSCRRSPTWPATSRGGWRRSTRSRCSSWTTTASRGSSTGNELDNDRSAAEVQESVTGAPHRGRPRTGRPSCTSRCRTGGRRVRSHESLN